MKKPTKIDSLATNLRRTFEKSGQSDFKQFVIGLADQTESIHKQIQLFTILKQIDA